ncbi:hypothetical protein J7L65_05060 [Candidatus Bathyarchaeota archaeon]|nr:hypothetical protein [Candidatus Bathyarchaeota archaeon]
MSEALELEADLIRRAIERRNTILMAGRERAEKILRDAEEEARRIREEAERRIKEMIESRVKTLRDRIIGEAEMEGRRRLMEEREKLISSVFDAAEARLREIAEKGGEEYSALLKRLILEAVEKIGGSSFTIYGNDRDRAILKQLIKEIEGEMKKEGRRISLSLAEDSAEHVGGVIVESGDGTKLYNNTLEGRIMRARRLLRAEVAKALGVI